MDAFDTQLSCLREKQLGWLQKTVFLMACVRPLNFIANSVTICILICEILIIGLSSWTSSILSASAIRVVIGTSNSLTRRGIFENS